MEEIKQRDEEGRVILDMFVKDDTDFLSKFSKKDSQVISSEVAEFLEKSAQPIPPKEPLTLRIYSDCIDEKEKVLYAEGIHKYYSDNLISVKREFKRNIVLSIILGFIGLVFIAISLILGSLGKAIWTEAIDIVAWVFCWEAVDILVFKNRGLRIDSLRYTALSTMKIEFYSPTEN